jgi:uncharacterized repeat protein (TIGR02543 family)
MKRWLCGIIAISILFSLVSIPAIAEETAFYLPANLTEIEEQAFEGNTSITSIVIPKSVQQIGPRAFAGCTGLTDVYVGNNPSMIIATDAFAGCSGVLFHVYPDSNAELYAWSHGFRRELLESGSPAWERAISMIGNAGFTTSYFNSEQFSTKRLIVKRNVDYLPDISAYNPTRIIAKGYYNIFVIQFDDVDNTEACCSALLSDSHTVYAEEDRWHEADTVTGAGVVDSGVWGTDDPIGFDTYAPFVKSNSSGTVKIAIVDSGVKQLSHYSSMLTDGRNMLEDIDGQSWNSDAINHGSVIASIIKDCVGNNSVRIIPIRVIGSSNQYDDELIAEGIDYAVAKGASIINLSMSFPQSSVVKDAINHATSSGVTIIVAAGNDARNVSGVFPANMSNVVTVSGISPGYKLSTWSNFGSINYCAPDNYINTTAYSNSLKRYTSFAAPMISAAYALVQLDKSHTLSDMRNSCILKDDPSSFGNGLPQLQLLAQIDPISISIDTSIPTKMKIGDTLNLSWTILPENTTNKTVTPSSSNTSILAITSDGNGGLVLNAVGKGSANFTLAVGDTAISATSSNVVVEQPVTGITITGAPDKLIIGDTIRLNASVSPTSPTPSNSAITWHSANNYAEVDPSTGVVTGRAEGTAVIYATANDGYGAESNRLSFPVVEQPDAESVTLYHNGSIANGETYVLAPNDTATITYAVSPSEAEQQVDFEVLSGDAVTVTGNVVRAVKAGTSIVMGMASTGRNVKATVTFVVEVPETGVTVTADSATLNPGDTTTCHATVSPANATHQEVTWSSNNPSVAMVDSSTGVVTAKTSGQAGIIATTHNGKTNSITITVRQPYTLTFNTNGGSANSSKTVYGGQAVGTLPSDPTRSGCTFKGWYTAANGGTQITASTNYSWTSSITVYAHWESGWVLESAVPSGAKVIATSWSYRDSQESPNSTMDGYTSNGNYWKQTGTETAEYADFPSGEYNTAGYKSYATTDKYYTAMMHAPYTASETETTKTEVSNAHAGWIYWHWAYNAKYSASACRIIAYKPGTYSDGSVYGYWYSIKSTVSCPVTTKKWNGSVYNTIGQYPQNGRTTYDCTQLINDTNYVPASHKTADGTIGLCTWRFYRLEYFTSTKTIYQKYYKFYKDVSYSATDPGNGSNISNKIKYVKWSNNQ